MRGKRWIIQRIERELEVWFSCFLHPLNCCDTNLSLLFWSSSCPAAKRSEEEFCKLRLPLTPGTVEFGMIPVSPGIKEGWPGLGAMTGFCIQGLVALIAGFCCCNENREGITAAVGIGWDASSSCRGGNGNPVCSCSTLRRKRCSRCSNSKFAISTSAGDALGRSRKWYARRPRQQAPVNFLVIRIGSQFSLSARYERRVAPSGRLRSPVLKYWIILDVYSSSSI